MELSKHQQYRAKNHARVREIERRSKARRAANGQELECTRRRRKNNPEAFRRSQWKTNGLPMPTRERPDVCECCGKPETRISRWGTVTVLHLDHCHATGAFRGWLCNSCNLALGRLGDNEDGVRKLLTYLERTRITQ